MENKQTVLMDQEELVQTLSAEDVRIDQIAFVFGTNELTYADLRKQAFAAAAALRDLGHDKSHIGLRMDRGPDAFVAMLAIQLVGGKCVPVNTSSSESYQRTVFEQAGCILVLADAASNAFHCPVLRFADLDAQHSPDEFTIAEDLQPGFILFTSGTTGKPKGVILPLEGVIAAARSFGKRTGVDSDAVIAQYAGLSFDAAAIEFVLAFVHRVPLNIMSAQARVEPEALSQELVDKGVTHLILPAAVAPYLPVRDDYHLRAFVCVGDVLEEGIFHAWAEKYPTFNGYGPTEASICTSIHRVVVGQPVTLGAPLDHLCIKIGGVDDQELLIGGLGLASGYIGEEALTADRFQPDVQGNIWYHTGDRVVVDPHSGDIAFAGRIDFQVKINGTRIETLALENTLKAMDGVDDAVVLACPRVGDQKFLATFIATSKSGIDIETAARALIAEDFPASHMPTVFSILPQLPLTRNQKVNRKALEKSIVRTPLATSTDPARAAFLSALQRSDCDDEANFFNVGGNSISAMRLLHELETRTGKHVSVKDFRLVPTIAGLRALLQSGGAHSVEIARNQRDTDELPLSPQQNTAWYMHQQDQKSKAYLAEAVHYFRGPLDISALENALQDLFDAHEIYRTTFHDQAGAAIQKIHANHKVSFERINARGVADQDRDQFVQNIIDKQLPGIPDLGQLPLANFVLVRFGENDHVFVHQEHHIVHDGWGGSAFTAELLNRYHQIVDPAFDYTPPCPAQYSDFLLTQNDWLQSPAAQNQVDYWRDQLSGAPQSIAIFGKASKAPGFAGDHVRLDFSRSEWNQCEETCARLGITAFGFTTAVLHLLLWQYSGQTDVVVGSPFANRNWRNAPDILGMLVNTIVLRQKIDPDLTLDEFATATQAVVDGAYLNQELPFGNLVEALNPERLNGQNPLFNVLLGFHDAPIAVADVGGFVWHKDETVISNTSKFDLDCLVVNRDSHFTEDDRVSFLWEYRSDIYTKQEIEDFVASFRQVFLQMAQGSTCPVAELSVFTPAQIEKVSGWENGPKAGSDHCFTERDFATALTQQLPKLGDHIALQTVQENLSYRALDEKSSALAGALSDRVASNAKVAILAPRSIVQIIAMVAVIKLKATVVCLDHNLPEARRTAILRDCDPDLLLQAGDELLVDVPFPVVSLDDPLEMGATQPERPTPKDHLAYITYTSGSTGRPKGVMVYASSLADECLHLMKLLDLTDTSTALSLSYVGFDAYHGEVWPCLMAGATLVLVSDPERDNLTDLSSIMGKFNVTAAVFPTGLFEQAFTDGFVWPETLNTLAAGGDRLGTIHIPAHFTARLYNLYGPTETTIDATFFEILTDLKTPPPIGRPKVNTIARVLDGDRSCPPGGVGELVIGGSAVAKGYLNKPEETQRSFVTLKNGERYYRTGDLVRWQSDGQLLFLGRIDDEISLRGYRIAPAEITTALQQDDDVSQAAVAVRNGALFAYVTRTTTSSQSGTPDAKLSRVLKAGLKRVLPNYMRPNAIIVLDRMPLTSQGKVDTAALPSPIAAPQEKAAPRNETETRLMGIWENLLPTSDFGVTQDFFSVGGHSLLAMKLIADIQSSFGVAIQISDFFESGTVRGLAEKLDLLAIAASEPMEEFTSEGEF
ncbi:MAG: amino acid adenylation domain-containing protein [Litoreibacter sp.]